MLKLYYWKISGVFRDVQLNLPCSELTKKVNVKFRKKSLWITAIKLKNEWLTAGFRSMGKRKGKARGKKETRCFPGVCFASTLCLFEGLIS